MDRLPNPPSHAVYEAMGAVAAYLNRPENRRRCIPHAEIEDETRRSRHLVQRALLELRKRGARVFYDPTGARCWTQDRPIVDLEAISAQELLDSESLELAEREIVTLVLRTNAHPPGSPADIRRRKRRVLAY